MNHLFLVSWDNLGLEYITDLTAAEQENMIHALTGSEQRVTNPLQSLILRAQFNPQRHYEIFLFNSDMSEEELKMMFEEEPQFMADRVRSVGKCLFSDRQTTKPVIV